MQAVSGVSLPRFKCQLPQYLCDFGQVSNLSTDYFLISKMGAMKGLFPIGLLRRWNELVCVKPVVVRARVGKEFPDTRQSVRKIEFIKEKGGLLVCFHSHGNCKSSADWAEYVYFQCAEREKNGATVFPYMGWERDRACCLGGLWDIAMVTL